MPDEHDDVELAADLEAFLAGSEEPQGEGADEQPTAASEDDAAKFLRTIRWLEREEGRVASLARAEKAKIDQWCADRVAGMVRRREALERTIENWTRATHAKVTTKKFPAGTLRLREARPHVEVTDEAAFIEWALRTDRKDLLRIEASKKAISDVLQRGDAMEEGDLRIFDVRDEGTGELVPGIAFVENKQLSFTYQVTP